MTTLSKQDQAKQIVGRAAADFVEDGMRLGLGTGSTTAYALEAIGRRIADEGLQVVGVPTSFAAERLARQHKIPLVTLDDVDALDLALDGADEVAVDANGVIGLVKGRGAALTREKVVAAAAARFVVLVDPSKEVDRLGATMPVPVEVLPFALAPVERGALRRSAASRPCGWGRRRTAPSSPIRASGSSTPRSPPSTTPPPSARRSTRSPACSTTACSSAWRPTCSSANRAAKFGTLRAAAQ